MPAYGLSSVFVFFFYALMSFIRVVQELVEGLSIGRSLGTLPAATPLKKMPVLPPAINYLPTGPRGRVGPPESHPTS